MENVVNEVEWAEPPRRTTYDWSAIADQLKSHPMVWGKVFDRDRVSVANAVRQGSIGAVHPDMGFEVRTTNNVRVEPRTCTLFLRWNPDKVDDSLRETITTTRGKPQRRIR